MNVNGTNLFVKVEGDASQEKVLIFVHGFPLSHKMWDPQVKYFKKDYKVITYDLKGHGQSDLGDGYYTMESHVDDLVALMNELGIKKAVLIGLSMGGYVVLRFMERHPDRVLSLVLMDTKSQADTNEGKLKRFLALQDIREHGLAPFAETSVLSLFGKQTLADKQDESQVVRSVLQMIMNSSAHAVMGTLMSLASRFEMTPSLPLIKVPTLLLVGEEDVITPPEVMKEMALQIPGSKLEVIPKSGHLCNLENPALVNSVVADFLQKSLGRSEVMS